MPIDLVYEEDVDIAGNDRVTLPWADNAIENTWLQVSLLANTNTGRDVADTFYLGNAIAETGNSQSDASVNLVDVALTRVNQTGFGTTGTDNQYDFNRDARVNLVDEAIARSNQTGFGSLQLIDLSNVSKGSDTADKPSLDASLVENSAGLFGEVVNRSANQVVEPSEQVAVVSHAAEITYDAGFSHWDRSANESDSPFQDSKSKSVDFQKLGRVQEFDFGSSGLMLKGSAAELAKLPTKVADGFRNVDSIEGGQKNLELHNLELDELVASRFEIDFFE